MGWRETKGKKPECLNDYDYMWLYSVSYGVEIANTDDYRDWDYYSHWQPADIKEPDSPDLTY